MTESPFNKATPIACALCGAQLTSFMSDWRPASRFVVAEGEGAAACEPCIRAAVAAIEALPPEALRAAID